MVNISEILVDSLERTHSYLKNLVHIRIFKSIPHMFVEPVKNKKGREEATAVIKNIRQVSVGGENNF